MSRSPPFIDPETNELDLEQIRAEAVPVAALVLLFAAVALVPFVLAFTSAAPPSSGRC